MSAPLPELVIEPRRHFTLLCPGPVNVDPRVTHAMVATEFGHREQEFSEVLASVRQMAVRVVNGDPDRYAAVTVTGSGTAGNETVLSSAFETDARVLVLTNGEFGERLAQISALHNAQTHVLSANWAAELDLLAVRAEVERLRPDWICMVHHETSTGMINPVEEVGAIARSVGAKLFVDSVSGYSAEPLDIERANVALMTTSAGKAIASYPGIALVIGRRDVFESLPAREPYAQYLSLRRHYEFAVTREQTPNTPAVPLLLALEQALAIALKEGVENRHARLARMTRLVRARLSSLGFRPLLEESLSVVVTSAMIPEDLTFDGIREGLRDRGYIIYGGKGPFEGRMLQVAVIGQVDEAVLDRFFVAFEQVIQGLRGGKSVAVRHDDDRSAPAYT